MDYIKNINNAFLSVAQNEVEVMNKKVLVVDDEPSMRDLFYDALTKYGYTVHLAQNAEEALFLVNKDYYPVSIFDLNLPGMSGIDLCREIRKTNPISIIYAITGYSGMFEIAECRSAGFDDYFIKPVILDLFKKNIDDGFEKVLRWMKK